MAEFGTVEVYEEMAKLINDDQQWAELGKAISYRMVFVYKEPVSKSFYLNFDEGKLIDTREIGSPEAEPADFILTAAPETWRAVLEKKTKVTVALTTGKVKVRGDLSILMKHMKAFNYVLEAMTQVELV